MTHLHEELLHKVDKWLATFVLVLPIICVFMMILLF